MRVRMIGAAIALWLCAASAAAQRNELSLTVGVMKPGESSLAQSTGVAGAHLGTSFALEADYSTRFFTAGLASLYFDFPLAVVPSTNFETSNVFSVRSYSSLYFTPGVKLKLLPLGKVSPYAVAGIGVARLNPSDERINGQPSGINNQGLDAKIDNAYSIGGGVDVKVAPLISVRGEVRDYNTGTPAFDINLFKKRQHNLLVTTGIVLRF